MVQNTGTGLLTTGWKGKIQEDTPNLSSLKFSPVLATASELQARLRDGTLTSVELVDSYLQHISVYNPRLHAVIQTAPPSLLKKRAEDLDHERVQGGSCGPLHGIPVLIKDNIDTDPDLGMGTTCGSLALLHAKPKGNASLVEGLVSAGAIILGKANLSEFAYLLGEGLICGWSAVGGQTQSAYIKDGLDPNDAVAGHSNATGSSSGSAVAVSAGFAPISIGTETCGSLVMPGNRAALYTMKPTIGLVSTRGIVPASDFCDSAGPMTKSVLDFANTLDAIVSPQYADKVPKGGYASVMTSEWKGIRVGCLQPELWLDDEELVGKDHGFDAQQRQEVVEAYWKMEKLGAKVTYPVDLISDEKLKLNGGHALFDLLKGNLRRLLDAYLSTLAHTHVQTLQEIVDFNNRYQYLQLPAGVNQDFLTSALASSWTAEQSEEAIAHMHRIARDEGIDHTLKTNDIDVIIGPADSNLVSLISASGYPIATLPLSTYRGNGRPFGLVAIAGQWQEGLLVKVMSAWEATMGPRAVPDLEGLRF